MLFSKPCPIMGVIFRDVDGVVSLPHSLVPTVETNLFPQLLEEIDISYVNVNSGMFHVPFSHPTPSASLSGFGVFFGSFWSVWSGSSPSRRCLLGFALLPCGMHA